jgi:alpha-1,2-glucosyltransferase
MILAAFPIAWFFGFLYYTEIPSLVFVIWTIVAAAEDQHWRAAVVCYSRLFYLWETEE